MNPNEIFWVVVLAVLVAGVYYANGYDIETSLTTAAGTGAAVLGFWHGLKSAFKKRSEKIQKRKK